ncbi:class I tRNA ligase family protein, partial [Candidatus Saccharibacteria bacterium]|nr:class I tRNA ligase family protein [Candidatus Saccharibacteria bacterium]
IWEVNKEIAKTLVKEGKALKVEYIQHDYPHCHRCNTKLMYRAHPSWFMDIQSQKQHMQTATDQTRWVPKAMQEGRFRNIIESAPDWNLSRDRYWATPIPVWRGVRNDGTEVIKVIGSYDEFEELTGKKLNDYHLPMVMDVTFECDGVEMHHIGKVLDCWFESGSMPFAQFHYPFENKEKFEDGFPADFITEAIDQTRGWFYSLTAVNVALFGKSPYKNLICNGFVMAADGRKLSKKHKNYADPVELMDKVSADSYRFTLMNSPLTSGDNYVLQDKDLTDVGRKLGMVWNMYDFFTMYAEVDGWEFDGKLDDPSDSLTNPLDQWIVSRVHQLTEEVGAALDRYELTEAVRPILPFIDDASNWYVRRSRKRFWKSEDDGDKNDAYKTLHYVLVRLSMIMAPFTPFLAEELYQKLTGGESVHLLDWPEGGQVNSISIGQMKAVRHLITKGLSIRAENNIKVRQPLASVTLKGNYDGFSKDLLDVVKEELNVKELIIEKSGSVDTTKTFLENIEDGALEKIFKIKLDLTLTSALKREGMMREVVRNVQSARKAAGLNVDDRIKLSLVTEDKELAKAIAEHTDIIKQETLAKALANSGEHSHTQTAKVDGAELTVSLEKAA